MRDIPIQFKVDAKYELEYGDSDDFKVLFVNATCLKLLQIDSTKFNFIDFL
jgi:hypothetical protein